MPPLVASTVLASLGRDPAVVYDSIDDGLDLVRDLFLGEEFEWGRRVGNPVGLRCAIRVLLGGRIDEVAVVVLPLALEGLERLLAKPLAVEEGRRDELTDLTEAQVELSLLRQ